MDPTSSLPPPSPNPPKPRVTRSSLACLPCRSRHLKCDGKRPHCSRCAEIEISQQCHYEKSRRGGLDRVARFALAQRRSHQQLAVSQSESLAESLLDTPSGLGHAVPQFSSLDPAGLQESVHSEQNFGFSLDDPFDGIGVSFEVETTVTTSLLSASPLIHTHAQTLPDKIENDPLINSYYKNFHHFHPFVLPRRHLTTLYHDPIRQQGLQPLIAILRFIGHLYDSQEWSPPLKNHMETCFSQAPPNDPFMVQCHLLYSIALFWHGHEPEAKKQMHAAARLALDMKMFQQAFATCHAGADPVLAESWRRTWWALYIMDGYYAGTLGSMEFVVLNVDATVELPCEEHEYESGEIPDPRTLQDFDCREFDFSMAPFSSFSYLIGAVRCAALAISTACKLAAGEEASLRLLQAADSITDGWLLLLPKGCKQVLAKTGEIDELMFQAHMVIHVSIISLHRPLSDLKFNAVEAVSSCARDPPADTRTPELVNVHTIRVLRAAEAQIRLLALPVRPFSHSPFITCMVSEGTLSLLSACNFLLKGEELAVARDQIRMTIGCLRELGEVWPRTMKNLHQIQLIARHVLRVGKNTSSPMAGSILLGGGEQAVADSGTEELGDGVLCSVAAVDDVCGWHDPNLGNAQTDFSWWMDE
ncbi:hypothetical protein B0T22DRAFT_400788 [Podospora appendiculata]|uniref:Zn(2)-C6 fungal-type domain-containing protein n=1 Tax=Podospora appendiculata TaxID=314037 RepID=A0AAE0XH15_9PEZI|nr:hypothetical protein B0T22DRAFT_400788 [Podospora appendiculata]